MVESQNMYPFEMIMQKSIPFEKRGIKREYLLRTHRKDCPELFDTCAIYCIENTLTGQRYVGRTSNAFNRMKAHYFFIRNCSHEIREINHDCKKFGLDVFVFKPLMLFEYDRYTWRNGDAIEFNNLEISTIQETPYLYNRMKFRAA